MGMNNIITENIDDLFEIFVYSLAIISMVLYIGWVIKNNIVYFVRNQKEVNSK